MTANRLEAMRQVVTNLLFEGQTSRAEAVMELIHEVVRLQDLLQSIERRQEEAVLDIRGARADLRALQEERGWSGKVNGHSTQTPLGNHRHGESLGRENTGNRS